MTAIEIWTYSDEVFGADAVLSPVDLTGFSVEALDGSIGKIDEASHEVGASYIVVDTGPWILGRKVLLPAGTIARVDTAEEKVYVQRTKDQIKGSPEFDSNNYRDEAYRNEVGEYYGWGARGWRGTD